MFAAFTATFLLTKNMVYAAGGILIARLVTLLAFDLPMARRAAGLPLFSEAVAEENEETRAYTSAIFCQALPLGITTVLLSLTSNIPRYLIADMHSEHLLGIFCSMAAVMQAGTLVFRAIELPTTPRLARLIREKDGRRFWRILNALLAIFLVVGLLGAAVSLVVGPRLLSIVFTPEYASMGGLLALLVLATAISQMAGMIEASMIAARMIKVQLPLHLVTTGLCLLAGWMLIPRYELAGAVIALTICRIPFMVFGVLLLRQKLRAGCSQPREPKANTEEEASPTDSRLINRRVA
jgi:O-antigen/teichoic acid export membrane protein